MKKLLSMVATTSNFQKVMLLFTHTFILYFHKITTEKKYQNLGLPLLIGFVAQRIKSKDFSYLLKFK